MNTEPVFSDRLLPLLALPGVLIGVAVMVVDVLEGKAEPWWLVAFATLGLGLFSAIVLTIPLYVVAKFQIFRSLGMSSAKAAVMLVAGLCLLIVGAFLYQAVGRSFAWLFEGSRFYFIGGGAFVLFLLVYYPYSLYSARKARSKLNVIDVAPAHKNAGLVDN